MRRIHQSKLLYNLISIKKLKWWTCFQNSMKKSDSMLAVFILLCCESIMQMLEEIFQYLVRNAYIIVAIDGTPFYSSGSKAFHLLTRNFLDCIVINQIGDFVLVLAKVFVICIAGFIGYELVMVRFEYLFLIGSESVYFCVEYQQCQLSDHSHHFVRDVLRSHRSLLLDRFRDDRWHNLHLLLCGRWGEWRNHSTILYVWRANESHGGAEEFFGC